MAWHFHSDQPVYVQIADRITKSVLSGEFKPGEQLPGVRQFAVEAAVNPNTVQHAFSVLEETGIVLSKGTLGRFVTEDRELLKNMRKKKADEIANVFIKSVSQLGIDSIEILELVKEKLS